MLHIPFDIAIDPMERLLLVNFEKDPDSLYVGFEPQVFDDGVTGKGHLVIGWRKDGRVDVYHEPGLRPDAQKYDIAGKGLAHMVEREMTHASFEVNDRGVQAHYEFQDLQERNVLIRINENHSRKRKPFGLLAPMGDVAENPSAMPLVLLQDFYFVRKKHSEVAVSVAGRSHRADMLPLPIDGNKMTFIRYSTAPLIATFNPAFPGNLPTVSVQEGHKLVRYGHREIHLEWLKGKPAIRRMVFQNTRHPVELRFDQPFPALEALGQTAAIRGSFSIEAHPSTGRIAGDYSVEKQGDRVRIVMVPTKGWKPRPDKLSLRFLYTVAKVFKSWPATYRWTADIEAAGDGGYTMTSGWKRIKK